MAGFQFPFEGELHFRHVDEVLPSAEAVLEEYPWDIDHYNAPYLAGKATEPGHKLVELTADQAFGTAPTAELPQEWSEADRITVVGDISHAVNIGSDFIVARAFDFQQAGELAGKMGYRPAQAGEFLQLLWWLQQHGEQHIGWFYCYTGRKPRYATLAYYNGHAKPSALRVIFDTYIGDQVEEGYMEAAAETHCFFVRSR